MPLKHNDGRPVSEKLFKQTWEDLVAQFGAASFQPGIIHGVWVHEGRRYEDELLKLVVDVEDTPRSRRFFAQFKRTLLRRFEQLEIYIISFLIDVL